MIFIDEPSGFNSKLEVAGIFVEKDGKILFLKRHGSKVQGNTWSGPGGKLDNSEHASDAILRETYEETGMILDKKRLEHIIKIYVRYPEYDFIYHIFRYVLHDSDDCIVRINPDEHTDYRWITPQDALQLPDLMLDEDWCIKKVFEL